MLSRHPPTHPDPSLPPAPCSRGKYYLIVGASLADVDSTFGNTVRRVLQGRRISRASSDYNGLQSLGTIATAMKRISSILQRSRSDSAPLTPGSTDGTLSPAISLSTPASPPSEAMFRKPGRSSNEFHRIPQFQTGMRPW